jgi:NADH:ubiquinone oxidoreductase subunit F (NADH-binding)/(2Fe-2S) ferredoxin
MNFEQVHTAAALDAGHLVDESCPKVYISASYLTAGAADTIDAIRKELDRQSPEVKIIRAGSMGYYDLEPVLVIEKPGRPGVMYGQVTPEAAAGLVSDYLVNDKLHPDQALCSLGGENIPGIPAAAALPFFSLQMRLVSGNCGFIDPGNINHYIIREKGYSGLAGALGMKPADVIDVLRRSGLRGRGGAGSPAADKWQSCLEAGGHYLVCNAVDTDPGSLTARLLLGSDPHAFLEGALVGAYAIGASHCYICVAAGDAPGFRTVSRAIEQMRGYGLVGPHILDSDFSVEMEIREIEPCPVAGEETALLRALEGRQARPYLRFGYAAPRGCQDQPALVDNIETFASVAGIFRDGAAWLSPAGTGEIRGTKIVTLTDGAKKLTVEVPLGTTLRTVVGDIGGLGDPGEIRAVRFGGCTGAFFPADYLDIPITWDIMAETGPVTGQGVMEIVRRGTCPVAMAREAVAYLQGQSCGQCVFCREGTLQMSRILNDITEFKARPGDLEMLEELGNLMKDGCICGLGSAAPNPVLSSLRHFRRDYDAHVKERRCLAEGRG